MKGPIFIPVSYTHLDVYKRQTVYQPTTMKDGQAAAQLRELDPECIVVVAYGKILPQEIIHLPEKGCINVHASLLPRYRGAAPVSYTHLEKVHPV